MKAAELLQKRINCEEKNPSGIYMIYCTNSAMAYIGRSRHIYHRWNKHKTNLNKGTHVNPHLQNSWIKYGKDGFVFAVLELMPLDSDMTIKERFYIDLLDKDARYNCQDILNEPCLISEETRKKQSLAHLGKTLPQEQKEKISAALKGRQPSENTILASKAKKGRPLSEEHKKALSLAKKGKRSSRASISDDLARQIYLEKKKTDKTCLEIAKENGVSLDIVKHITNPNSKSWCHIRL